MKHPSKRINELEDRCEALENAVETIRSAAWKTGVKLPDLRRTIAKAIMKLRMTPSMSVK